MELATQSTITSDEKLHVVLFPWLAFGHLIPYLKLAKLIAHKGHKVSFLSTPRNIDRLSKTSPTHSPLIILVKLPLPLVPDLPEDAEATIDIPYQKTKYLKKAYDELQQPITDFLHQNRPDWLIHDFAAFWLGPVAASLGISTVFFSVFLASTLCFGGPTEVLMGRQGDGGSKPEDFTVPPKWIPFPSTLAFRPFEVTRLFGEVTGDYENISTMYRFGASIEGCDAVAVRSSYEFEPEWLKLLQEIHHKPILPVGLLPPTADDRGDDDVGETWLTMKEWLDEQREGSVVYVAFGTESELSQSEVREIALGLELSGLPFFWVLRGRRHSDSEVTDTELPDGFEERTRGQGVVWRSWVPQVKILCHGSVGGFLTHSGLGSVIEAVQFGKALMLIAFLADTALNARVLEAKKIGYVIPRDERDGSFTKEAVKGSLRMVMVEEEGKIYRDKVKETREVLLDRSIQDKCVADFLDYLKKQRRLGGQVVGQ
ncbi:Soyasaponin III rhamnosyltransferase [Bertholletia excelsa]